MSFGTKEREVGLFLARLGEGRLRPVILSSHVLVFFFFYYFAIEQCSMSCSSHSALPVLLHCIKLLLCYGEE